MPGLLPPAPGGGRIGLAATDLESVSQSNLARGTETVLLKTVLLLRFNSTVFESTVFCTLRGRRGTARHGAQTRAGRRGGPQVSVYVQGVLAVPTFPESPWHCAVRRVRA